MPRATPTTICFAAGGRACWRGITVPSRRVREFIRVLRALRRRCGAHAAGGRHRGRRPLRARVAREAGARHRPGNLGRQGGGGGGRAIGPPGGRGVRGFRHRLHAAASGRAVDGRLARGDAPSHGSARWGTAPARCGLGEARRCDRAHRSAADARVPRRRRTPRRRHHLEGRSGRRLGLLAARGGARRALCTHGHAHRRALSRSHVSIPLCRPGKRSPHRAVGQGLSAACPDRACNDRTVHRGRLRSL